MLSILLSMLLGPPADDQVALFPRRQAVAASACADGQCAAAKAPAVSIAKAGPIRLIPPARLPALPGVKQEAPTPPAPPPFPGPSAGVSRVLQVWDNGVVWERATNTWYWQDSAGNWYHQP
jgi:hypothetical protein